MPLPTGEEAAALGYVAVMVTAAGFTLWYRSIERVGVDRAGLFAGLMPVSALLTAAAIGASELTLVRLLGAIAVGAGVVAGVSSTGCGPAQERLARFLRGRVSSPSGARGGVLRSCS